MKIALGSDHHGFDTVRWLVDRLTKEGHDAVALGATSGDASDYPDAAYVVARAVADGDADGGVLVCGSGVGMSMAANKVPGVRAGLAIDEQAAEMMRRHNDANVLCLAGGGRTPETLLPIVRSFLAAEFEGGRHQRRVAKMTVIEQGGDPRAEASEATSAR